MKEEQLRSCRLKIVRAGQHLATLSSELEAWAKSVPMRMIKESDNGGRIHKIFVEIIAEPPLDHWSLVAGDCIHNLRSALDSLLYGIAVYQTGLNPPADAKVLQFPIVTNTGQFLAQKYRIKSLSQTVQDVIESLQPYNRPHADVPPLLELLGFLNNQDKHRIVSVIAAAPHSSSVSAELVPDSKIESVTPTRTPIIGKTEILSFTINPPAPGLQYQCEVFVTICIVHPVGPSKSPINELATVLTWLQNEVQTVISQLSAVM